PHSTAPAPHAAATTAPSSVAPSLNATPLSHINRHSTPTSPTAYTAVTAITRGDAHRVSSHTSTPRRLAYPCTAAPTTAQQTSSPNAIQAPTRPAAHGSTAAATRRQSW